MKIVTEGMVDDLEKKSIYRSHISQSNENHHEGMVNDLQL